MQIDFHAHILPRADHGSNGIETSLKQVELARQAGIEILAATPHFYPATDTAEAFLERRKHCHDELMSKLGKDRPEILLGAEVQLCKGLDHLSQIRELCFRGTDVILLELPGDFRYSHYARTIEAIKYDLKMKIVFAHVDRYPDLAADLIEAGYMAQLNASSLCTLLRNRRLYRWIEQGSVVALGSDLHGVETGYSQFLRAKTKLGPLYDQIMSRTAQVLGRG
ncbi:MAG: hypothetical protein IKT58_07140 [Oscillospiraceae bacterium]|nr:hypothetical protein [Oscillospiraceae bacterium]